MATGRENHLTKAIGEYLVCAELCRRNFIATSFTGNVPDFDVLAVNEHCETIPIQVKAIRGGDWQLHAGKFLDISINDGVQTINGKNRLPYPDLICVYVKLNFQGKDEFFIFRQRHIQSIIKKNYNRWLIKHNGRRPKNPESLHVSVSPDDLSKFRDNWQLLKH